jgi:hypothetical protein
MKTGSQQYIEMYEKNIPPCCELKTFNEHVEILLCWGITSAIEKNTKKSNCGDCEYNTEK